MLWIWARTRPMHRPWSLVTQPVAGLVIRSSQRQSSAHQARRGWIGKGRNGVGGRFPPILVPIPATALGHPESAAALHSPHFRSCVSESKALPCHLCLNVACEHLIPRADATTVTLRPNSVSGLGNDGLELCRSLLLEKRSMASLGGRCDGGWGRRMVCVVVKRVPCVD
ncbi:hypothetical protein V8C42DRAFT_309656 [Trichoderma barbatum]